LEVDDLYGVAFSYDGDAGKVAGKDDINANTFILKKRDSFFVTME